MVDDIVIGVGVGYVITVYDMMHTGRFVVLPMGT